MVDFGLIGRLRPILNFWTLVDDFGFWTQVADFGHSRPILDFGH